VRFRSHALPEFWDRYNALTVDIREKANKQYSLFETNPYHLKAIAGAWRIPHAHVENTATARHLGGCMAHEPASASFPP
jgi:hypothetical protein